MLGAEDPADAIAWFRELSEIEPFRLESWDEMAQEWLIPMDFSTEDNELPAPPTPATSSSTGPHLQPCQNPEGSCIITATRFLKSLHAPSPSCVMLVGTEPDRQPQQRVSCAVDDVLSTTQKASRLLRGLVQCRCRESPQLQLLVTVICSEAVSWYRRVIATYHRGHSSAGSLDSEGDSSPRGGNERVPLHKRPFRVGEHHFEGPTEAMLIGQVVAGRLQELERIIGDAAWKTTPWSQGIMGSVVGEGPGSETLLDRVHTRRNGFLNDQLNAAKRELASSMTLSMDSTYQS